MLSVDVILLSNTTIGDVTEYDFKIQINRASVPTSVGLQGYFILNDELFDTLNTTSADGLAYASFQIPNSDAGPVLIVVFGRSLIDDRITCFGTYSFAHLSDEPMPNNYFLETTTLNYELLFNPKFENITLGNVNLFTFSNYSMLSLASESAYSIPYLVDKSPMVMVISGICNSSSFIEWIAYPDVPLVFGSDFRGTDETIFSYIVAINEVFYKLNLKIGAILG